MTPPNKEFSFCLGSDVSASRFSFCLLTSYIFFAEKVSKMLIISSRFAHFFFFTPPLFSFVTKYNPSDETKLPPADGTNCFHFSPRRSLTSAARRSSNRPLNFIKAPDCLRHMAASGVFSSPGPLLTGCALGSCHGSVKLYLCVYSSHGVGGEGRGG